MIRRWLAGDGVRAIARSTGLDRKTIRPLIALASGLGLAPGGSWPDDATMATLIEQARRPVASGQPGQSQQVLLAWKPQIRIWLEQEQLLLTKVHELLNRQGVSVPYSSLHRFVCKWCDFGSGSALTVPSRRLASWPKWISVVWVCSTRSAATDLELFTASS